jgi:hypothetical protein
MSKRVRSAVRGGSPWGRGSSRSPRWASGGVTTQAQKRDVKPAGLRLPTRRPTFACPNHHPDCCMACLLADADARMGAAVRANEPARRMWRVPTSRPDAREGVPVLRLEAPGDRRRDRRARHAGRWLDRRGDGRERARNRRCVGDMTLGTRRGAACEPGESGRRRCRTHARSATHASVRRAAFSWRTWMRTWAKRSTGLGRTLFLFNLPHFTEAGGGVRNVRCRLAGVSCSSAIMTYSSAVRFGPSALVSMR